MADAVSEEIEELKVSLNQQIESKLSTVTNRLQNTQLGVDKNETEISKVVFELDKLRDDVLTRVP